MLKIHAIRENLLARLVACLALHSTDSTSIFNVKLQLYIFFFSFLLFDRYLFVLMFLLSISVFLISFNNDKPSEDCKLVSWIPALV